MQAVYKATNMDAWMLAKICTGIAIMYNRVCMGASINVEHLYGSTVKKGSYLRVVGFRATPASQNSRHPTSLNPRQA